MRKINTLKKNYEFKNVIKKGKYFVGKHIIIYLEHYFVYLMGIYHILMDCME